MITVPTIKRVASGGICNSAAAVDLALITVTAVGVCLKAYNCVKELSPGAEHAARTFSAAEVAKLISSLVGPLDRTCAALIDNGDGRTVAQAHEDQVIADTAGETE